MLLREMLLLIIFGWENLYILVEPLYLIQKGEHHDQQTIRLVYCADVRSFGGYYACCWVYHGTTNAHSHRCFVCDYGTSLFYCIRYCKEEEKEVRVLLET